MPLRGAASATSATMAATSSAAMGWKRPGESLTMLPSALEAAMPPRNSRNWSCPGFVDTPSLGRKGASTMPKSHRPYPPAFRRQMIELVRRGRTPEELGQEFEPSAQAIRNWVKQAALDAGQRTDGLTTEEHEELRRLRRENRQLREERAILSKAAAWFARETNAIPSKDSSS